MPTVAKASGNVAKLGDLSTYNVATSAIPYDTTDTSGAVPTVSLVLADGEDTEYLIDETLTLSGPALGNYVGEVVEVSGGSNSSRYSLSANTLLSRLNSEQRVYPSPPFIASTYVPLAALDYWTQQCGIFYDDVPGEALFYRSQFLHWFGFSKGTVLPIRGINPGGTGGEDIGFSVIGGRTVTGFGKNRSLVTTLRTTEQLAVQVPAIVDSRYTVFSSGVLNVGTGRQATITWNFETPTKAKASLQVTIDNGAGISLAVRDNAAAYTSVGTVAGATNGDYRFHVGVKSFSATQSTFVLNVVSLAGTVVGTATANLTSLIAGNLSLASIVHRGEDQGSGDSMMHWGEYIALVSDLPTSIPATLKSLTNGTKVADYFTGFSGNVWEHIKAYCSIYHLDFSFENGRVTSGPRNTAHTATPNLGSLGKNINSRDKARYVEVVNLNSEIPIEGGIIIPKVMWSADTVYQVAVGETQEFLVQTDHSILELSQPVAVSGITPFPYKSGVGQYVVTGSDGYIVSPTFWRDQGGKITVDTTGNEGEIKVVIKGPDYDSARAPYRISEGDAGRPALHVTGKGVLNKPTTIRVGTGNSTAAKEIGATIESPFIGSTTIAYDVAARAARQYATPDMGVSVNEALDYDKSSALGVTPAGKLIKSNGNILRVTSATQTPSSVSGSAVQHNTVDLVKQSFGTGATIGDLKTFYAGKTIKQTNLKPLKVVK